jgi:hypothetical protein
LLLRAVCAAQTPSVRNFQRYHLESAAPAVSTTPAAIAASESTPAIAAAPVASSATGTEFFFRSGLTDGYGLAIQRTAVEPFNRFRGTLFRFHFDKAETFGLTAEFVFDDRRGRNFSRFAEIGFKIFIRNLIRQVADIQIFVHFYPLSFYLTFIPRWGVTKHQYHPHPSPG